ncbi:hypothetical protein F511_34934 [Dorcoceras hygrometricum]|uniref:Uncharacterized protein n=1 Tax=Dorcoceras hygrometricum TaxID=472368 RepID=A0A2Z7BC07_9LAMI|nr:hypothetical protein F511_34934 [Dorcoceras hygrometricum]
MKLRLKCEICVARDFFVIILAQKSEVRMCEICVARDFFVIILAQKTEFIIQLRHLEIFPDIESCRDTLATVHRTLSSPIAGGRQLRLKSLRKAGEVREDISLMYSVSISVALLLPFRCDIDVPRDCFVVILAQKTEDACLEAERVTPVTIISLLGSVSHYEQKVKTRAVESDVEDKRSGSSYEQKNDSDVRRSCEEGIWIKCEERSDVKRDLDSDVKRSLFSYEEKGEAVDNRYED